MGNVSKRAKFKYWPPVLAILAGALWISMGGGLTIPAVAAGVAWTVFVVWYAIRAKWWKTQVGQNVMILGLLLAFSFDRLAIVILQTDGAVRTTSQVVTGVIMYGLSAFLGVWRTILMEKAQREKSVELAKKTELGYNRRKTDI